jgi:thiol-disulfide isomerase/thioredoxin
VKRAIPLLLAGILLLAGCTADPLTAQYGDGTDPGYISGDGAYLELPVAERGAPVAFAGSDEYGDPVTSDDFAGTVTVVNFWYAGCPPCRVEAPDLAAVASDYADVAFLGVNTSDGADVALLFAQDNGIPYRSVLDAATASMQLAFAGTVAPNAVPSTIILDREGRVAGRISGLIADRSILESMLDRVLGEHSLGES